MKRKFFALFQKKFPNLRKTAKKRLTESRSAWYYIQAKQKSTFSPCGLKSVRLDSFFLIYAALCGDERAKNGWLMQSDP